MANDANSAVSSEIQSKTCTKCGETKPLSEFGVRKSASDGLRASCKSCECAASAAYRAANVEKVLAYDKRYKAENVDSLRQKARNRATRLRLEEPEIVRLRKREWRANNPEAARRAKRKWYAVNAEKVCASVRKKASTPSGKIDNNFRSQLYQALKKTGGSKSGESTFSILGYSRQNLMEHLEGLFLPGMTWENYGSEWHVDHNIPLAVHNYSSKNHIDFKRAWSLSNLRPLWASENISKGAKLMAPFQPNFAF